MCASNRSLGDESDDGPGNEWVAMHKDLPVEHTTESFLISQTRSSSAPQT